MEFCSEKDKQYRLSPEELYHKDPMVTNIDSEIIFT